MDYNSSQPNRRKVAWLIFGAVLVLGLVAGGVKDSTVKPILNLPPVSAILEPEHFEERLVEGEGDDKIVLTHIDGIIAELPDDGFSIIRQLNQAKKDDKVKAIIIEVNSPGGTVTASQTLAEKISEVKTSGKKIVVAMRELAASGGYYIAAPADKIVANPSTITGSIGVIFQTANLEELFKKIGYQPITFKAGKFKDIASPERPISDEEKKIIENLINEEYTQFVDFVAANRKLDKQKITATQAAVLSGRQAKDLGLVDELGNRSKAIEIAKKEAGVEKAKVVEYTSFLSFFENIFSGFFEKNSIDIAAQQLTKQGELSSGVLYLWIP